MNRNAVNKMRKANWKKKTYNELTMRERIKFRFKYKSMWLWMCQLSTDNNEEGC